MLTYSHAHPLRVPLLLCVILFLTHPLAAHVIWSRVNDADPRCLALYHFDTHAGNPGSLLAVQSHLPVARGLTVGTPTTVTMQSVHDTPSALFEPHALAIKSAQSAESTATLANLTGDLTIECWFKWDAPLTSQSVQLGLRSGAKLTLVRDTLNPANDRFGLTFTHGDYAGAPGFTNWPDVGEEEAALGEWRHVAVTVSSTGMHLDTASGHDVYNSGSVARFWLNGHAVGTAPHTVDLTGLRAHDASKIRILGLGGAIKIDEFTLWNYDWSQNGLAANPFADGRGAGLVNAASRWPLYQ